MKLFSHRKELRAKAARICEDFSSITMPMKRAALLAERRMAGHKVASVEEPLTAREIAAGMTELKKVKRQLASLLSIAEKVKTEQGLLDIIRIMENRISHLEAQGALELAGGKSILLSEELKLHNFGKQNLDLLADFSKLMLKDGSEFVLSPDPRDNQIYLDNFGNAVGSFTKKEHLLSSTDELCYRHCPTVSAKYDEHKKMFVIEAVPITIALPGKRAKFHPIDHNVQIFKSINLNWEKFVERVLNYVTNLGIPEQDAKAALDSEQNYSFVFRSLERGEEAGKENAFLGTRVESRISLGFGADEGRRREFGVEGTLVMPENRITLVMWAGNSYFTDDKAHVELQSKDSAASRGLFLN